jgi:hypothetical protein
MMGGAWAGVVMPFRLWAGPSGSAGDGDGAGLTVA